MFQILTKLRETGKRFLERSTCASTALPPAQGQPILGSARKLREMQERTPSAAAAHSWVTASYHPCQGASELYSRETLVD